MQVINSGSFHGLAENLSDTARKQATTDYSNFYNANPDVFAGQGYAGQGGQGYAGQDS